MIYFPPVGVLPCAPAFWNVGLFLVTADGTLSSLSKRGVHNSAGFDVTW